MNETQQSDAVLAHIDGSDGIVYFGKVYEMPAGTELEETFAAARELAAQGRILIVKERGRQQALELEVVSRKSLERGIRAIESALQRGEPSSNVPMGSFSDAGVRKSNEEQLSRYRAWLKQLS